MKAPRLLAKRELAIGDVWGDPEGERRLRGQHGRDRLLTAPDVTLGNAAALKAGFDVRARVAIKQQGIRHRSPILFAQLPADRLEASCAVEPRAEVVGKGDQRALLMVCHLNPVGHGGAQLLGDAVHLPAK